MSTFNINDFNPEIANSFNNVKSLLTVLKVIIKDLKASSSGDIGELTRTVQELNTTISGENGISNRLTEAERSLTNIIALIGTDESELDDTIDKYIEIVNFLDGVEETTLNQILAKFVRSDDVKTIVTLTQAEYDALATKDVNTEYNIIESV